MSLILTGCFILTALAISNNILIALAISNNVLIDLAISNKTASRLVRKHFRVILFSHYVFML